MPLSRKITTSGHTEYWYILIRDGIEPGPNPKVFDESTGHNGLKICTVCHFIIVYKCYFIKISVS